MTCKSPLTLNLKDLVQGLFVSIVTTIPTCLDVVASREIERKRNERSKSKQDLASHAQLAKPFTADQTQV